MTTVSHRRSAVDGIRQENETAFGPAARAAVQRMLTPALPHPWMYVYELTQNALDAGARRVCWRTDGDRVLFQHDGDRALDESHVRGIASLGASTKDLAAVGFMGIGFKSVFARFRKAQVSGFDRGLPAASNDAQRASGARRTTTAPLSSWDGTAKEAIAPGRASHRARPPTPLDPSKTGIASERDRAGLAPAPRSASGNGSVECQALVAGSISVMRPSYRRKSWRSNVSRRSSA